MASRDERGWEPDLRARVPGAAPAVSLADRAAALRDDLAALEQERETLEDEWATRDRQGPPSGSDELEERTPGLADWERAHGRAELELRAIEGGWWDEWLGRAPAVHRARQRPSSPAAAGECLMTSRSPAPGASRRRRRLTGAGRARVAPLTGR